MVRTHQKLLDISHFIHPIGEILFLYYCSKFKRIFHITTFFVTTFFVIAMQTYTFSIKPQSFGVKNMKLLLPPDHLQAFVNQIIDRRRNFQLVDGRHAQGEEENGF